MPKYRKKPVVIEAVQLPVTSVPDWLTEAIYTNKVILGGVSASIYTLEGVMIANPGDWIIQGVAGEIYPCKPDIFTATYEKVEDIPPPPEPSKPFPR